MIFFSFNFPLREYFFFVLRPPLLPTPAPHKFLMVRPLKKDKSIHLAVNKLKIRPISGPMIVIRDQISRKSLFHKVQRLLNDMELYHSTE